MGVISKTLRDQGVVEKRVQKAQAGIYSAIGKARKVQGMD